jgi:DNA-binding MarR family transcriptional regulator
MHLLECVAAGGAEGIQNRAIAQALRITPPSATAAVTKLEKKGLVRKQSSTQDGRQIRVVLTPKGEEFNRCHQRYHEAMVERAAANFTEEEQKDLVRLIRQLNQFFRESIEGVNDLSAQPVKERDQ